MITNTLIRICVEYSRLCARKYLGHLSHPLSSLCLHLIAYFPLPFTTHSQLLFLLPPSASLPSPIESTFTSLLTHILTPTPLLHVPSAFCLPPLPFFCLRVPQAYHRPTLLFLYSEGNSSKAKIHKSVKPANHCSYYCFIVFFLPCIKEIPLTLFGMQREFTKVEMVDAVMKNSIQNLVSENVSEWH